MNSNHVASLNTPVLLLVAVDGERGRLGAVNLFDHALKKHGKDVRTIRYDQGVDIIFSVQGRAVMHIGGRTSGHFCTRNSVDRHAGFIGWTIGSAKLPRLGNRASTLCIRLPNSLFRPVAQ